MKKNIGEAEVRECEIFTTIEEPEPSYRPDGGFGYLSPEEVKIIKERVTAEYAMREREEGVRQFETSNGPLQDVMLPRDEPENELPSSLSESQQGIPLSEVKGSP
jgi:hypothetical protein